MILDKNATYYDILELDPDATPQEILESYLRLKEAYSKNSLALYSLFESEETNEILNRIEEAYIILSQEEKRKKYDLKHLSINSEEIIDTNVIPIESNNNDSGSSPMDLSENMLSPEELTSPTDFSLQDINSVNNADEISETNKLNTDDTPDGVFIVSQNSQNIEKAPPPQKENPKTPVLPLDWTGCALKNARLQKNISIEEISSVTKISKRYLNAIEEDNFSQLPAAVFVRGFIIQIAKKLKLPAENVASSYIEQYKKSLKAG